MKIFKYFIAIVAIAVSSCTAKEDRCIPIEFGNVKVSLMNVDSTYYIYIPLRITNTSKQTLMIDTRDSINYKEPNSCFIAIIDEDTIFLNEYRPVNLLAYDYIPPCDSVYLTLYSRDYERYRHLTKDQLRDKLANLQVKYDGSQKELCMETGKLKDEKRVVILPNNVSIDRGFLIEFHEFSGKDYNYLIKPARY